MSGSPRDSDHLDKVTARLPQVPQVDSGEGGGLHDSDYGTLTFLIPYSRRAEVGSGEVKAEGREEVW